MKQAGTIERSQTGQAPVYDLVVIPGGESYGFRRPVPARPNSGFVTQLLLGADPVLRPARLERTRSAVAAYAATAQRIA